MINISAYPSGLHLLKYSYGKLEYNEIQNTNTQTIQDPTFQHYVYAEYEIREHISEKDKHKISLQITISQPDELEATGILPFKLSLEIYGLFQLSHTVDDTERSYHLNVSAPSMLYGIARELIRIITSSGLTIAYLLPSVSFAEIASEKYRQVQNAESTNMKEANTGAPTKIKNTANSLVKKKRQKATKL